MRLKIYSMAGLALLIVLAVGFWNVVQMKMVGAAYASILGTEIAESTKALEMQVAFKTQVQEWKNLLLRGGNPDKLKEYAEGFDEEEAKVQKLAQELLALKPTEDVTKTVTEFVDAHNTMKTEYGKAREVFAAGGGKDPDAADKLVQGIDRAPTELLTAVVDKLGQEVQVERDRLDASSKRQIWVMIIAVIVSFFVLATFSAAITENAVRALKNAVGKLETVSTGDFTVEIKRVRPKTKSARSTARCCWCAITFAS